MDFLLRVAQWVCFAGMLAIPVFLGFVLWHTRRSRRTDALDFSVVAQRSHALNQILIPLMLADREGKRAILHAHAALIDDELVCAASLAYFREIVVGEATPEERELLDRLGNAHAALFDRCRLVGIDAALEGLHG
jgi:hypothetical protein